MAIAHAHADTTGTSASTTATTTITVPTGSVSTDILILVFSDETGSASTATSTPTAPSGWTSIFTSFETTGASGRSRLSAWWAAGNVANLSFTNGSTGKQQGWVCAAFSGVDNTTPIDATGTTNSSTGASSDTANAVTVATANAWELIAGTEWLGGASIPVSATGFTETDGGGANADAWLLYNTTPKSTGSTGTVVVNNANAATTNEILQAGPFALRPAAAATYVPYDIPHSPQHQAIIAM